MVERYAARNERDMSASRLLRLTNETLLLIPVPLKPLVKQLADQSDRKHHKYHSPCPHK
jgi:hypothetical protein